jgi:molybdopterin converting factor small subunit
MFSLVYQPDGNEIDLIDDIEEWYEEFEEEDDDDDDDDLDELQEELGEIIEDYLENIEPCIMVKAKFVNNSTTKYVILAVNDPLTFKIISKNINGQAEVILDRNNTNNGNLIFDPSYWFSIITPKILNDAFIGVIDGKKYIFLNKYVNSKIYNSIFNRMEESTSLIINE